MQRVATMKRCELEGNVATFRLTWYLSPGGRYPYEDLPGDLEMALSYDHEVVLLSVPGFVMLHGVAMPECKRPWGKTVGFKFKTFDSAAKGLRA